MDRSEPIPDHRAHYKKHGWAHVKRVLPVEVADATLNKMQQELGGDWESYRAADIVKRAEFKFPAEDAPEKINPNRTDMVKERGHE